MRDDQFRIHIAAVLFGEQVLFDPDIKETMARVDKFIEDASGYKVLTDPMEYVMAGDEVSRDGLSFVPISVIHPRDISCLLVRNLQGVVRRKVKR